MAVVDAEHEFVGVAADDGEYAEPVAGAIGGGGAAAGPAHRADVLQPEQAHDAVAQRHRQPDPGRRSAGGPEKDLGRRQRRIAQRRLPGVVKVGVGEPADAARWRRERSRRRRAPSRRSQQRRRGQRGDQKKRRPGQMPAARGGERDEPASRGRRSRRRRVRRGARPTRKRQPRVRRQARSRRSIVRCQAKRNTWRANSLFASRPVLASRARPAGRSV